MSGYDPARDLETAHQMADAARAAILPYFRAPLAVDNKLAGGFDPVTVADRASERAMRAVLAERAPDDGILGEEFGETAGGNGRRWILDPIDGTRAFIAGLPTWTVLIALECDGRPRLGVIDQPHIGERFTGVPGAARLAHAGSERVLQTRPTRRLDEAILSTTDIHLFVGAEAEAFAAVHRARAAVPLRFRRLWPMPCWPAAASIW